MVISGGHFKPEALKPKEVVSLLLDDAELECKCKSVNAMQILQGTSSFHNHIVVNFVKSGSRSELCWLYLDNRCANSHKIPTGKDTLTTRLYSNVGW